MKENSKVLALKYRPTVFKDLIGQDVIRDTILSSIIDNKTPNAYLFTGIRGVGKTTTARIVAKALNCKNGVNKLCEKNMCENCEAISNSNHIDVLEMDAASKTGVDDVRDLIEFSRYGPSIAKYKIFIIDEVHMLSKQAFNALLKTLEEPPTYKNGGSLKFIFATTEIKKIPVTVVSRCQRFDLSRVKSIELFNFLKNVKDLEGGNISDEAIKLIVKISEGSVRDALSLLDRAIISQQNNKELDLKDAQKIFGYFDKSLLIDLFKNIFDGDEEKVLQQYRLIYDQGVEPKVFLNDFLEILYYLKNINSLKIDGTNFSLNDEQFETIKDLSAKIENSIFLLFWQFTIQTMQELDIISNQNLSIEMFLIRLIYIKGIKSNISSEKIESLDIPERLSKSFKNKEVLDQIKGQTIDQIKNIVQEDKDKLNIDKSVKNIIEIKSFDELIKTCDQKKEIKLKYELENNVNLVSFEKNRIEISFNEDLSKDFLKIISSKLFNWTGERWIITLSKKQGELTKKQIKVKNKKDMLENAKKTKTYKTIKEIFDDAELVDVKNEEIND
ncbi:DNA polymerase III subunit gamma/tau [Candidatus Pelagibacter communis]|uniref:DNA polymerase III subunit gamma/tau n=1 Tax=Pelagibacter ubique TaxID=198252 RepID=UPI00094C4443|nr:DNA polymerase III subunit gamma/tau [Candidatus Pelagibacter ubique]